MFTDEHWPGTTRTQTWATLADLWDTARQRLPDDVWDFLVGGSGDDDAARGLAPLLRLKLDRT